MKEISTANIPIGMVACEVPHVNGPTLVIRIGTGVHTIPVAFFQDVLDGKRKIEELDDWRETINVILRERLEGWVK